MKQVGLAGGTVPPFVFAPFVGEGGQPAREVSPIVVAAEVTPVLFPLFWQRGRGMMLLGRLATRSQRPL